MKFVLKVGTVGALARDYKRREFEVDDEDLEGLDEDARARVIDEYAQDVMNSMISWDWEPAS